MRRFRNRHDNAETFIYFHIASNYMINIYYLQD